MQEDGKPVVSDAQLTDAAGTATQQAPEGQTANPVVEVSSDVKNYLKGLGLESAQVTPELIKVAEAGMKQKSSVSRLSAEREQLLARIQSQGQDAEAVAANIAEETQRQEQTPPVEPKPQAQPAQTGITDNDLFDLAQMINTNFKEIAPQAEDGSLFRELRQLGYFNASGINKKAVFDYLAQKNAAAQELRELREFKEKYNQPNPAANPVYNPQPGYNIQGELTQQQAHSIVLSGDKKHPRYNDAIAKLKDTAMKTY